tara:strand:- start:229 stop:522 length:294 start_codon:yes stop_codon:yes gene_type:complete
MLIIIIAVFVLVVRSIELKNKIAKCKGDVCTSDPLDRSCIKCGKILSSYDQSIEDWLSLDPEEASNLWLVLSIILGVFIVIVFIFANNLEPTFNPSG